MGVPLDFRFYFNIFFSNFYLVESPSSGYHLELIFENIYYIYSKIL